MRIISILIAALLICLQLPANAYSNQQTQSKATPAEKQMRLTPQEVLKQLKAGNARFVNDHMRNYNFAKEMKVTTKYGQHPIAVVLSCMDSRSIPDILFDQGLGNIFVARVAGNVVSKNMLGSMEFATEIAGSRLIVVMGHTRCGAIQGACNAKTTGNLHYLLNNIKPAVTIIKKQKKNQFNCQKMNIINSIAKQNVLNQMQSILSQSQVIKRLVAKKKIAIIGAMHNLKTGEVNFFTSNGSPI